MGWYRGRYYFNRNDLNKMMEQKSKDYYFRVRNKHKADEGVVNFVFSDMVKKDRRCYCASAILYQGYLDYCSQQDTTPLSNRQFKKNMQLLGFVYQKHHRFYVGYYGNKVTTAYKNICLTSN